MLERRAGGITPAYAGKSGAANLGYCNRRDHPRLCGEKADYFGVTTDYLGSPPPMRGKACFFQLGDVPAGITPAYAGKSSVVGIRRWQRWDHPRLCGEKFAPSPALSAVLGSPPPMRGKVAHNANIVNWNRITPAYAGKRTARNCGSFCLWDHPRLCGEKTKKIPKQRYFFHQPASFSFSLQYT